MAPAAGDRVLDVGCGLGKQLLPLSAQVAHITGVDVSPDLIAAVRDELPADAAAELVVSDMDALGTAPLAGPFDLIYSVYALYYSADVPALVDRLAGLLARPAGRLFVMAPDVGNNAAWFADLGELFPLPEEITSVAARQPPHDPPGRPRRLRRRPLRPLPQRRPLRLARRPDDVLPRLRLLLRPGARGRRPGLLRRALRARRRVRDPEARHGDPRHAARPPDVTRPVAERRAWDQQYYREVLELFAGAGYRTATFSDYHAMAPAERSRILLLRQDIDERLDRARVLLEVHRELGFTSTWFVHVHASYNAFFYDGYAVVRDIVDSGAEVALHSNFVEFATYFDEDPLAVLRREKAMLEAVTGRPVRGHACHRDVNYVHNSLPYLEAVGHAAAGFAWQALRAAVHGRVRGHPVRERGPLPAPRLAPAQPGGGRGHRPEHLPARASALVAPALPHRGLGPPARN